jgi:hypothetical protein
MSSTAADKVRDHFLGWQCRIRQIAMRQDGGRPSPGMRPRLLAVSGQELCPALTVLLLLKEPAESTAFFRFQVMKSADPRDIYERALAFLQADHFQKPSRFTDRMLCVLPEDSEIAAALLRDRTCVLEFEQFSQTYRLACEVSAPLPGDAAHDAAIWHNRLFNPALSDAVHVLCFQPDWTSAVADPAPSGRRTQA